MGASAPNCFTRRRVETHPHSGIQQVAQTGCRQRETTSWEITATVAKFRNSPPTRSQKENCVPDDMLRFRESSQPGERAKDLSGRVLRLDGPLAYKINFQIHVKCSSSISYAGGREERTSNFSLGAGFCSYSLRIANQLSVSFPTWGIRCSIVRGRQLSQQHEIALHKWLFGEA